MMLELKGISKIYHPGKDNEYRALKKVDLMVEEGEFIAIIGESGAGKSTLLHILGGVETFEEGSYRFKDQEIKKMTDRKISKLRGQEIGFVLQDFGLLGEQTVIKNVSMPLYFDSTPMKEINRKALEAIETIGITELKNKKVRQLSGGQKQRVAIARAIVNTSSVILADEPTGALDGKTSLEIMEVFQKLNSLGKTIIIVTHEMYIADLCRRRITIADGEIIRDERFK